MKLDKRVANLICELERKIGNQTYNPNSYNGWTGEEGQEFKYPVNYCASKQDLENKILSKTKYIDSIPPECIGTMKYKFGSNHLYIGDGLIKILEYLENIYELDFNELEEQRYQRKLVKMQEIKMNLDNGNCIEIKRGKYIVGVDIPEGDFVLMNNTDLHMIAGIYYQNGNEKKDIFTRDKEVCINLKNGEVFNVVLPLYMKKSN